MNWKGINQIQVNPEINVTFAAGLRHILRQDPDKVLVGEIRDYETAEMGDPYLLDRAPCLQFTPHK